MVNKYNAKKVVCDGISFDSKNERDYYLHLRKLKSAGEIHSIQLQPEFELQPKFVKNGKTWLPIKYRADFLVIHNDGTSQVVDVKGMETTDFKLKKKMFEYKYPERLNLVARAPKYLAPQEWIELNELMKIRKEGKRRETNGI